MLFHVLLANTTVWVFLFQFFLYLILSIFIPVFTIFKRSSLRRCTKPYILQQIPTFSIKHTTFTITNQPLLNNRSLQQTPTITFQYYCTATIQTPMFTIRQRYMATIQQYSPNTIIPNIPNTIKHQHSSSNTIKCQY